MTALAAKLDDRVRLGCMPKPQERAGFRVVAVLPFPRNAGSAAPAVEEPALHEPADVLKMSAHGGDGNAFGQSPLHESLERVESALEHVRGPEQGVKAPLPTAASAAEGTAMKRKMNAFEEHMFRAYSPLLEGKSCTGVATG